MSLIETFTSISVRAFKNVTHHKNEALLII